MFGRHVSAISRIQTTTIKPAAFRHASFSRTIHPKLRTRIRSFTAATTFVSSLDIGFSVTPRQLSTAVVSNLLVVNRGRRTSSYNCFRHTERVSPELLADSRSRSALSPLIGVMSRANWLLSIMPPACAAQVLASRESLRLRARNTIFHELLHRLKPLNFSGWRGMF